MAAMESRRMRRVLAMLLVSTVASLRVAVTGAGGKTGSLCFSKLHAMPGTEVVGVVRSKSPKLLKRLKKLVGAPVDACLHQVDVTKGVRPLAALFREQKVDALLIATSAVPKIKKLSILKALLAKLLRRKGARPEFRFAPGGTPEEVDWLGAKNQIDAAISAGVPRVVFCSSMGGTQPDNFLNTIGTRPDGTGGQILFWKRKAEMYAVESGLDVTVLHPGGLLDQPGGRQVVFGVDDTLLERKVRSIPRADVAETMIQSLFCKAMSNRSLDLCSEETPRMPGGLLSEMLASTALGNCDYALSPGEPKSQF